MTSLSSVQSYMLQLSSDRFRKFVEWFFLSLKMIIKFFHKNIYFTVHFTECTFLFHTYPFQFHVLFAHKTNRSLARLTDKQRERVA